ncbi:hypothetical protein Tco_0135526, partial [Tanacetum coccineum]
PLSGAHTPDRAEGALNLEELSVLCTNLSNRVLALETTKDAQAAEILKLKTRIKKLEKKCKPSISHHKAWLKSVKRLSMKKRLGKKESVSKQGRKNAKPEPNFDAVDDLDADLSHGMDYRIVVKEVSTAVPETVSTARPEVSTARPDVDAARQEVSVVEPRTPPTTTNFNDEEMTLADTLVKLKDDKAKGVAFKDTKEIVKPARSVLTLKPLPTIDPKDKSKGVLEEESEPAKKMTKSDFDADKIARDEEVARQLEVEWQAE